MTFQCDTPDCPGYLWPCGSDCDESRPYVERCDLCQSFDNDADAATRVAKQHDGLVVWACIYDMPGRWQPAVYPWPPTERVGEPFYIESEAA